MFWRNSPFALSGIIAGRQTSNGDFGEGSAWFDSEGNWGIECRVSNHSIWCHDYRVEVQFGFYAAISSFRLLQRKAAR